MNLLAAQKDKFKNIVSVIGKRKYRNPNLDVAKRNLRMISKVVSDLVSSLSAATQCRNE